ALVVLGPGRGRIGEDLPAGVLHRDQRLAGCGGVGDRDVAGALRRMSRMPAERPGPPRRPPAHRTPQRPGPVPGALAALTAVEGRGRARAVGAECGERPPLCYPRGEHLDRRRRVRIDQDLLADRRDGAHGLLPLLPLLPFLHWATSAA